MLIKRQNRWIQVYFQGGQNGNIIFWAFLKVLQTESVQSPEAWPLSLQRLLRLLHPGVPYFLNLCLCSNFLFQVPLTSRYRLVTLSTWVYIVIVKSRSSSLGRGSLPTKNEPCLSRVIWRLWSCQLFNSSGSLSDNTVYFGLVSTVRKPCSGNLF